MALQGVWLVLMPRQKQVDLARQGNLAGSGTWQGPGHSRGSVFFDDFRTPGGFFFDDLRHSDRSGAPGRVDTMEVNGLSAGKGPLTGEWDLARTGYSEGRTFFDDFESPGESFFNDFGRLDR